MDVEWIINMIYDPLLIFTIHDVEWTCSMIVQEIIDSMAIK